jgi:regulatory protein
MSARGIPADIAEEVLDRFEEVGLVDDQAFAAMLVRTRHGERGLVGPALAQELRRRGVEEDVARTAMSQVSPAHEADRAQDLAAKKLAATRGLPRDVRWRRTAALLARKGYDSDTARRAITTALASEPGPDDA